MGILLFNMSAFLPFKKKSLPEWKACHGARSARTVVPGPRPPWSGFESLAGTVLRSSPACSLSQSRALPASGPCSCLLLWPASPLIDVSPAQPSSPTRNSQDASSSPRPRGSLSKGAPPICSSLWRRPAPDSQISVPIKRKLRPRDKGCPAPGCTARRVVGCPGA